MKTNSLHPWNLLLFTALSLADLFLTYQLLKRGDGFAYESNPIANWWLQHFSWLGLAGFKIALMVVVQLLLTIVSLYRPRTGRRVLAFGCAVLFGVVCYSGFLLWRAEVHVHGYTNDPQFAGIEWQGRALDDEINVSRSFTSVQERVSADLVAGRCTLDEAVKALARTTKAQRPEWIACLRMMYPGHSDVECLAANVIQYTLVPLLDSPAEHRETSRRLTAAFQSWCGRPLPRSLPPGAWKRPTLESAGAAALPRSAG